MDIKNPNYQKWSHFFTIIAGRFCLTDLLLGKEKPADISADEWQHADYLLQSWIYGTITEDLSSMVLSKTAMAHDLWKAPTSLFTDNEDYRAIQLEEQFKSLKKGSLSIHDYCHLLKTTADNLADVGNPVPDKQLVLQTLYGLPKHYGTIVNLISFQTPLPSFVQIRSLLQMEEHRIAEPEQTPTVLYVSRPNSSNNWPNSLSNYRGGGSWRNQRGDGRTNCRGGRGQLRYPMQHYGSNQFHNQSQSWRAPYTPQTFSSILGHPPPPKLSWSLSCSYSSCLFRWTTRFDIWPLLHCLQLSSSTARELFKQFIEQWSPTAHRSCHSSQHIDSLVIERTSVVYGHGRIISHGTSLR
ncbi:PREDICTED: uncharacterized protein LOC105962653 [Erythranthe guttata]|uniref:uncharacterized protein LOC105962653 n=1 Tax=Erythranthe guttata TaxID=4155 RepID=UPI00064DEBFA|nr:PREDICTED: uncharacterized protein LOC105962653 [Erythranthe guttata]|eukprot:XP_012842420.1 PREDICTED: uncharacterized protein LOC105962653 [Erythranthe guttata]